MFSLIVSDRRTAGFFRTRIAARILAFVMTIGRIRKFAFLTISQTGIRYPESPLSLTQAGLPGSAPHAGDRFPWLRLKFQASGPLEDLYRKLDDTSSISS